MKRFGGLGAEAVYDVDRIACRGLVPDLTLVIDVDVETGLSRAHRRNQRSHDVETRLDEQSLDFYRKVRAAYHQLAEDEPRRVKLIDGSLPEAEVGEAVWSAVQVVIEAPLAK